MVIYIIDNAPYTRELHIITFSIILHILFMQFSN